mmetsp:Transcript_35486/g.95201  ORF Transcript_35486/g.95201 Transcript_35486/m.95201 type:complete len:212 (+) Transcript_35486:2601-3236(+)
MASSVFTTDGRLASSSTATWLSSALSLASASAIAFASAPACAATIAFLSSSSRSACDNLVPKRSTSARRLASFSASSFSSAPASNSVLASASVFSATAAAVASASSRSLVSSISRSASASAAASAAAVSFTRLVISSCSNLIDWFRFFASPNSFADASSASCRSRVARASSGVAGRLSAADKSVAFVAESCKASSVATPPLVCAGGLSFTS